MNVGIPDSYHADIPYSSTFFFLYTVITFKCLVGFSPAVCSCSKSDKL